MFSNSDEEEKAQIFKIKANWEIEKRRSSVWPLQIQGLISVPIYHLERRVDSANLVKEEDEGDSDSTSEKFSKHFPPKQEDLIEEAKLNKSLAGTSEVLSDLNEKPIDFREEINVSKAVDDDEESKYTRSLSDERFLTKKMSKIEIDWKWKTGIAFKLSLPS